VGDRGVGARGRLWRCGCSSASVSLGLEGDRGVVVRPWRRDSRVTVALWF
jgi:hypothetical protein